jgi:putative PIN family toxin of toxin-antitoxin system
VPPLQVVIDTNVLFAGLRSRRGSSFRVLQLVGTGAFDLHISVPLVLEYEEILLRELPRLNVSRAVVDNVIDYLCAVAVSHEIFFLWRPYLPDCDDDMVLELAVAAECEYVITYNTSDFRGIDRFGIEAVEPRCFLQRIGQLP